MYTIVVEFRDQFQSNVYRSPETQDQAKREIRLLAATFTGIAEIRVFEPDGSCTVFDQHGRYQFTYPPPKRNQTA